MEDIFTVANNRAYKKEKAPLKKGSLFSWPTPLVSLTLCKTRAKHVTCTIL